MASPAFKPGDRVCRGDEFATVTQYHSQGSAFHPGRRISVQPDNRRRSLGTVVWECLDVVKVKAAARCPVCGDGHDVLRCPERV